jgi:hypothetical protein
VGKTAEKNSVQGVWVENRREELSHSLGQAPATSSFGHLLQDTDTERDAGYSHSSWQTRKVFKPKVALRPLGLCDGV